MICANPLAKRVVNDGLRERMTAAGISRMLDGIGATLSAEVINRHRKHWADDQPLAPKGARQTDIAVMVRDRVAARLEDADADDFEEILFSKGGQGAIATGLKAQKLIEDREKEKAKTGRNVELLAALFQIVGIGPQPLALDDGNTIEGEAVEVDGAPV